MQSHHTFSYDQQRVSSDIAHFVKGSFITSFPTTNSKWVTLHILWKSVSSHLFLWPIASEWHFTFVKLSFIFYDQQGVSDSTAHFGKAISSHLFYDQQSVSNIRHVMQGNLITSFPMANRLWVTLDILWKSVSSHLFLWPTASSEWHWTFCES